MNIKLISKALHTLSLLSDEDIAIVFGLRSASEDERSVLTLALEPNSKPQKKSSERTIEHCAACDYTRRARVHKDAFVTGYHEFQPSAKSSKKSAGGGGGGRSSRGTSIKNQLSNRRQEQPTPTYCAHVSDDGDDPTQCRESESSGIHDATMGYRNYHPFQPPVTTTASGGGG